MHEEPLPQNMNMELGTSCLVQEYRTTGVPDLQYKLYAKTHCELKPFSLASLLQKRYRSWASGQHWHIADTRAAQACSFLDRVAGSVKPAHLAIILKTLLDAWCTAAFFGKPSSNCPFCGASASESLHHFTACSVLHAAWQNCSGDIALPSLTWLFIPCVDADVNAYLLVVVHIISVYHAYNFLRTSGRQNNQRMYSSLFRAALNDSTMLKSAIHVNLHQMLSE